MSMLTTNLSDIFCFITRISPENGTHFEKMAHNAETTSRVTGISHQR